MLNSLTGAAQRAGLELLAFGGRFVEIGKRDIYGDTRLGLFPFRRNLTFHCRRPGDAVDSHPQRVGELLHTVYQLVADGELPLPKHTDYPLAEAANAIRVDERCRAHRQTCARRPARRDSTAVLPPEQAPVFRRDGAYIVTGGLGGAWAVLGREDGQGGLRAHRADLALSTEFQGAGDNRAHPRDRRRRRGGVRRHHRARDRRTLVAAATANGLPLRGVLHAAGVVEDATLANITDELIDRGWAPKVNGAWNLHKATTGQPLDWFCAFSSAAALVGSPGQGAYAAANSWLDAFTQWRRARAFRPTRSRGEHGVRSAAPPRWQKARRRDDHAQRGRLRFRDAAASRPRLHRLRADHGHAVVEALGERSPFAEAFKPTGQSARTQINSAPNSRLAREEWPTRLRRLVAEQVSLILRRSIDLDRPVSEYGLDSLGYLELRTRIEMETGIRVGPTDITTIRGLADHLCGALADLEGAPA